MAVKGLNFNLGARVTGQPAFTSFQRALNAITAAGNSAKTSMRGVSADVDGFGNAVRAVTRETLMFEAEFNRLQAKFNPTAAQIRNVEESIRDLNRAQMLGAVSAESHGLQLLALQKKLTQLNGAQSALIPVSGRWNRGLSDSNRAIQQAGFQINDFFIQVAGGQNIVLAFTQQMGQLVQFFGAWGSVAGAALAVGGALYLMFADTKTTVEKLTDANDALGKSLSSLSTIGGMSLDDLRDKYGKVDTALMSLRRNQRDYDLLMANKSAVAALDALYADFSTRLQVVRNQSRAGATAMQALRSELGFSAQDVQDFGRAFTAAMNAVTIEDKAAAFAVLDGYLSRSKLAGTELANEVRKVAFNLRETGVKADNATGAIRGSTDQAAQMVGQMAIVVRNANAANASFAGFGTSLSSAVGTAQGVAGWAQLVNANITGAAQAADDLANTNMASGIAAAAGWASALWTRLSNAAAAARAIAANPALAAPGTRANLAWQYAQYGMGRTAATDATNPLYNPPAVPDVTGGGGGGGTSPIAELRKDYEKLMADMSPLIASTKAFRDANAEAMAAFDAGNVDAVKSALAEAADVAKEFKSVADSIAGSFMTAFSGIMKGTKNVRDAATDMLNAVLDKTIELLMMPVFEGIAGFVTKGILGGVGALGAVPSFDGGGGTGSGPRSGGLDGKGGFLSIMHPKETVTDHTRAGGGMGGDGVTINVMVDGATGNGEIMEMVSRGVSAGLQFYDAKVLPKSIARISANPRRT